MAMEAKKAAAAKEEQEEKQVRDEEQQPLINQAGLTGDAGLGTPSKGAGDGRAGKPTPGRLVKLEKRMDDAALPISVRAFCAVVISVVKLASVSCTLLRY